MENGANVWNLREASKMGVIPINFTPDVEIFIKGMQRGNRSQWVNRQIQEAIRAKSGDQESTIVEKLSAIQLVQVAVQRFLTLSKWHDTPEENRMLELRNMIVELMRDTMPKDL